MRIFRMCIIGIGIEGRSGAAPITGAHQQHNYFVPVESSSSSTRIFLSNGGINDPARDRYNAPFYI